MFTYLPCCFIVTFCPKICSPTYHDVLPKHFFTKLVHQPTMMFYRNILSQNLFTYLPCGFIETFCPKIYSPTYHAVFIETFCHKICLPTYHDVLLKHFVTKFVHLPTLLFYRNILSQNLSIYLPCCFIVTFCRQICSPTYHAVLP